ncbi:MAG: DUF1491 family protein [Pseudomonadota bacterium]
MSEPRVTSALWVAAYLRRIQGQGGFAVVAQRGAEAAGAIYIHISRFDGHERLIGPAPQVLYESAESGDRRFAEIVPETVEIERISDKLARESRFDPDLWIIAVEDRDGRDFLDAALVS